MEHKLNEVELLCIVANATEYSPLVVAMAKKILSMKKDILDFLRDQDELISELMDSEEAGYWSAYTTIEEKFEVLSRPLTKYLVVAYNGTQAEVEVENIGDVVSKFTETTGLSVMDIKEVKAV